MVIPKENCEDSAPCRTPDDTILLPVISFSLLCSMPRNHCAISPEFAFQIFRDDPCPANPIEEDIKTNLNPERLYGSGKYLHFFGFL